MPSPKSSNNPSRCAGVSRRSVASRWILPNLQTARGLRRVKSRSAPTRGSIGPSDQFLKSEKVRPCRLLQSRTATGGEHDKEAAYDRCRAWCDRRESAAASSPIQRMVRKRLPSRPALRTSSGPRNPCTPRSSCSASAAPRRAGEELHRASPATS